MCARLKYFLLLLPVRPVSCTCACCGTMTKRGSGYTNESASAFHSLFTASSQEAVRCVYLSRSVAYQADDLLSPRGAGPDVRADENVVIPGLEIVDQVVGRFFLVRVSQRCHSTGGEVTSARGSSSCFQ